MMMASGLRDSSRNAVGVDRVRDGMNDMKIRDDKVNDMSSSSSHLSSAFHLLPLFNI